MIEFWSQGAFSLLAEESGVYVYTPDGENWAMERWMTGSSRSSERSGLVIRTWNS